MKVLAETTAQVLVDDTITLPVAAVKVDEIVASVKDIQCYVIGGKVIFQGVLHKQIFFVDMKGFVRHTGVDIPFSGFVDLPGVPAGASCMVTPTIAFLTFQLVSPKELRETVVIDLEIRVVDVDCSAFFFPQTLPANVQRFSVPGCVRAGEIENKRNL